MDQGKEELAFHTLRHNFACMATSIPELGLGEPMIFPLSAVHKFLHGSQKVHLQLSSGGRIVGKILDIIFCTNP